MGGDAADGTARRDDGHRAAAGAAGALQAEIVIPAYNEALRLPAFLADIAARWSSRELPATRFDVVDVSSDPRQSEAVARAVAAAGEVLSAAAARCSIGLISVPHNRGKGHAIRLGWARAAAAARWLGFVDADGSISAAELARLLSMLDESAPFDVLAGARIATAGRSVARRWHRRAQGRIFAAVVERLFCLGLLDPQCGVKFVRGDALRSVLPLLREERWLLDVELLALLKGRGARLCEEPIDWAETAGSKVVPVVDPLRMLAALWRLRRSLPRRRVTG